jgi:ABC-type branched-subunit amino acid transport system substrate-binding protein
VAGKQIELIVRDDASFGETGKRLIQELVVNDKVDIGGGLTADLIPSAPLLTEAQKPTVIMLSSTTAVVAKSPFFVRTSCTLAQSSAIMADWAVKKRLSKGVTLVTKFAPGLEAEETFTNNYKAAGGQVVEAIRVPLRSPDFAPFLQRVKDASPQALFVFIPSTQAAAFAKQFVERGLDKAGITLIGPGDLTDDEALQNMGDAILGTVTAHLDQLRPVLDVFLRVGGGRVHDPQRPAAVRHHALHADEMVVRRHRGHVQVAPSVPFIARIRFDRSVLHHLRNRTATSSDQRGKLTKMRPSSETVTPVT